MRSEDWIPTDIRRILAHPRFLHFAACACLMLLVLACFWGVRSMANRRLEPLLGGQVLNRHDLVEVERALIRSGLLDYKIENGQVLAPTGLRSRYSEALMEQGALPKALGELVGKAVAEFSILETSEQMRFRLRVAGEQEISRILSEFDGIDDAAVHYAEDKIGGLHPTKEIKAMVAVRPSVGAVIDAKMLASIRNAVAAYKAGLDPVDVTIVNLKPNEIGVVPADDAAQAYEVRQAADENAEHVARNNGPFLTWMRSHLNQIVQATVVLLAIALVVGVFRDLFYEDVFYKEGPPPNAERPAQDLRVYTPNDKKQSAEVESQRQDTSPEQSDTLVHTDLTELVREHPQAASAMLKSWVKEAS